MSLQFGTDLIAFRVARNAHEGLHLRGQRFTPRSEAREVLTLADNGLHNVANSECRFVKWDQAVEDCGP